MVNRVGMGGYKIQGGRGTNRRLTGGEDRTVRHLGKRYNELQHLL